MLLTLHTLSIKIFYHKNNAVHICTERFRVEYSLEYAYYLTERNCKCSLLFSSLANKFYNLLNIRYQHSCFFYTIYFTVSSLNDLFYHVNTYVIVDFKDIRLQSFVILYIPIFNLSISNLYFIVAK